MQFRDKILVHLNLEYDPSGVGGDAAAVEVRAYKGTAYLYENLVQGIQSRAEREGWPKEKKATT